MAPCMVVELDTFVFSIYVINTHTFSTIAITTRIIGNGKWVMGPGITDNGYDAL